MNTNWNFMTCRTTTAAVLGALIAVGGTLAPVAANAQGPRALDAIGAYGELPTTYPHTGTPAATGRVPFDVRAGFHGESPTAYLTPADLQSSPHVESATERGRGLHWCALGEQPTRYGQVGGGRC